MSKYARIVNCGLDDNGQPEIRATDVVDMGAYSPLPDWYTTDEAFLDKIFANHKDEWTAAGTWFVSVPDDLGSGAIKQADGSFTNPPAPPPAPKPTTLTTTEFKKRLTLSERAAILQSPDMMVKTFLDELTTAVSVSLVDPDTVQGANYLEHLGLIAPGRAAEILTP